MAPPRPLHCTGAQGPSGAAGQPQNGIPDSHPESLLALPRVALRFVLAEREARCTKPKIQSIPMCIRDVLRVPVHRPGREASCSKPKIQSIPSCIADVLNMPVHSKAVRMGPAARWRKPMLPLWTAAGERGVRGHVRKVARQMLRTAPRTPPPHPLLRHVGALFIDGAPLRQPTRLLSTESSSPSASRRLLRGGAWR